MYSCMRQLPSPLRRPCLPHSRCQSKRHGPRSYKHAACTLAPLGETVSSLACLNSHRFWPAERSRCLAVDLRNVNAVSLDTATRLGTGVITSGKLGAGRPQSLTNMWTSILSFCSHGHPGGISLRLSSSQHDNALALSHPGKPPCLTSRLDTAIGQCLKS